MKITLLQIFLVTLLSIHAQTSLHSQSYSLEMTNTKYATLLTNGAQIEETATIGVDIASGNGEIFLGGSFPEIALNNLQIGYLGGDELGLDGDIVPYSSVTFDLGNNVSDEHWDQVVATTFVTYNPPLIAKSGGQEITNALNKLLSLKPRKHRLKSDQIHTGFSVEELEQFVPETIINSDIDYNIRDKKIEKKKTEAGINYNAFIPILVKAIQEQQAQIEQLKIQLAELESKRYDKTENIQIID